MHTISPLSFWGPQTRRTLERVYTKASVWIVIVWNFTEAHSLPWSQWGQPSRNKTTSVVEAGRHETGPLRLQQLYFSSISVITSDGPRSTKWLRVYEGGQPLNLPPVEKWGKQQSESTVGSSAGIHSLTMHCLTDPRGWPWGPSALVHSAMCLALLWPVDPFGYPLDTPCSNTLPWLCLFGQHSGPCVSSATKLTNIV